MGPNDPVFPDSDAWAASMPEVRDSFAVSARRKTGGQSAAEVADDKEFKSYASLDLSNMGM